MAAMKESNFDKSNRDQAPFAKIFEAWLNSRPNTGTVEKACREDDLKGVDYWVTKMDGQRYSIQLKVDFIADKTQNLPFEVVSQARLDRNSVIGSQFKMIEVDYIFFLLAPSLALYGYRVDEFLQYIIFNYSTVRNFVTKNVNKGKEYWTLGGLIPIEELSKIAVWETRIAQQGAV